MDIKKIINLKQTRQAAKLMNRCCAPPKAVKTKDMLCKGHYYLGLFKNKSIIVGYIVVKKNTFYGNELKHLVISPAFRKRGLGTKLVKTVIKK